MTVFVNTTTCGDEPDAPPVPCCLALASGDFDPSSRSAPPGLGLRAGLVLRCQMRLEGPPTAVPLMCPSGRLVGGVAALRCCAALALTRPPPAKGVYASTRCRAETATLIKIRVFFVGYPT